MGASWQACNRKSRVNALLEHLELCLLASLTSITNGMPAGSTTMCRLGLILPLSFGLEPVSWLLGVGSEEL